MMRLDPFIVAGLTGTPRANSCRGFTEDIESHSGSSPALSDATLRSLEDADLGSSIRSDDLGDIEFSDDDFEDKIEESGEIITDKFHSLMRGVISRSFSSSSSSSSSGRGAAEFKNDAVECRNDSVVEERGRGRRIDSRRNFRGKATRQHSPSISPLRSISVLSLSSSSRHPLNVSYPTPERLHETATSTADYRTPSTNPSPFDSPTSSPIFELREEHAVDRGKHKYVSHSPAVIQAHSRFNDGGETSSRAPPSGSAFNKSVPEAECSESTLHEGTTLRSGHAQAERLATATPAADAPIARARGMPPQTGIGEIPTATCKILVVGNAKCGKSSIISRFVTDRFSSDYNSTVGADYAKKDVSLKDGRKVRLQLWDIAGQDRFAKLTRAYFRRAKGAVVVCDVTREGTFDAIVRWKEEIDAWCQNEGCALPVYLFANKCDLLTEVHQSFLAGARMERACREAGFSRWHVTSAKRGDNIDQAMTQLLEDALEADKQEIGEGCTGRHTAGSRGSADGQSFQLSRRGIREGTRGIGQQACCA